MSKKEIDKKNPPLKKIEEGKSKKVEKERKKISSENKEWEKKPQWLILLKASLLIRPSIYLHRTYTQIHDCDWVPQFLCLHLGPYFLHSWFKLEKYLEYFFQEAGRNRK
jgi:hypothetical protein